MHVLDMWKEKRECQSTFCRIRRERECIGNLGLWPVQGEGEREKGEEKKKNAWGERGEEKRKREIIH